jgi:hypothetical protein
MNVKDFSLTIVLADAAGFACTLQVILRALMRPARLFCCGKEKAPLQGLFL